jgi:hypothetical protein
MGPHHLSLAGGGVHLAGSVAHTSWLMTMKGIFNERSEGNVILSRFGQHVVDIPSCGWPAASATAEDAE